MGIIYILENKINGKRYVGQTSRSFNQRFEEHNQSNSLIGKAIQKYGVNNFNKILLENVLKEEMDTKEKECIIKYNAIYPNGYNWQDGGCKNKHHHPETIKKIGELGKGKIAWNKGKHHTKETIKKISESKKGKHPTEEARKKMSEAQKGRIATEETIQKLREANIGRHHTEETKEKLSKLRKGKIPWMKDKHHTKEANRKNSKAHKGQIPWNKGKKTGQIPWNKRKEV